MKTNQLERLSNCLNLTRRFVRRRHHKCRTLAHVVRPHPNESDGGQEEHGEQNSAHQSDQRKFTLRMKPRHNEFDEDDDDCVDDDQVG